SPKDIDKATKKWGFPVGSATLFDEVGIDVAAHIARDMYKVYGERLCDKAMPDLLADLVKNGLHGRKSGKGLYLYQQGVKGGERELNPQFSELTKLYAIQSKEQSVECHMI
ncbi:unnamed protein product, partial [Didymodactylos carnosus]